MERNTEVVNIAAAKARLPELVERASEGEVIILARHGKPKARLVSLASPKKKYVRGSGIGKWKGIEDLLDKPLPDDILEAFYERRPVRTEKES